MAASSNLVLGIDLGGTKILSAVITPEGTLVSREHSITPADYGPHAVMDAMAASAARALVAAEVTIKDISAIGIAAPGLVDPRAGMLFTSPNLPGWREVPLRDIIQEKLGRRAFLINDGKAGALAEHRLGAGQGADYFIYVTISTGIGGGIIAGSELYSGYNGFAGEIGHMTINDTGPRCYCGNTGCWESLASGTALAREARLLAAGSPGSAMMKLAGGDLDRIKAEVVEAAARAGDEPAQKLIDKVAYYTGIGLANLINIFNPQRIAIGGGLANMGDMLLKPAIQEAGRRAFAQSFRSVEFHRANLGRNSSVLGAAIFARLGIQGRVP